MSKVSLDSGTLLQAFALEKKRWVVVRSPYSFSHWHLQPRLGMSDGPLLKAKSEVSVFTLKPCCLVTVFYAYASYPFKGFLYWKLQHAIQKQDTLKPYIEQAISVHRIYFEFTHKSPYSTKLSRKNFSAITPQIFTFTAGQGSTSMKYVLEREARVKVNNSIKQFPKHDPT